MTLSDNLVAEAERGSDQVQCHSAVLRWLKLANVITGVDEQVVRDLDGWESKFLVRKEDRLVDQLWLESRSSGGLVVGFFADGDFYNHSMVTTSNGMIAGVRNAYVMKKPKNGYVNIRIRDLYWRDHRTVGSVYNAQVRVADVDTIRARIKKAWFTVKA
jgi:hypothetical protein